LAKNETRLGKGLGALLGEYLEEEAQSSPAREIRVDRIQPNPFQPRDNFEDSALAALADSIRQNGLLQPLVVRPAGEGWELVAGERRWRALQRLGWERVPAVVRELRDEQMLVLSLVENLERESLSALEEALGYQELIDRFGLTQKQVAKRMGRDRSTVANSLRLLGLSGPVRELLASGALSAGHARAILGVKGEAEQLALARTVVDRGLSVRETERRARGGRTRGSSRSVGVDPVARRAERVLARALGTRVTVRLKGATSGEIRIQFHDAEDFERIVRRVLGGGAEELFPGAAAE